MKNLLLITLIALLSGCVGESARELRNMNPAIVKLTSKSKDDLKLCLLEKLDNFIPDRLVVNELSNRSEILVGVTQAGRFRNYYLFTLKDKEISMSNNSYFGPLSIEKALDYVRECSE